MTPFPPRDPPQLSSRTRPAATRDPGLRCPAGSGCGLLGCHPGLGPLPLCLCLARQSRISVHICQSGCWLVVAFPSELSFGEREARAPCTLAGRNVGQVLGRGTAPRPATWQSPSCSGYATTKGAPVGSLPCPKGSPMARGGILPRVGRAPIPGTRSGVPEDHASKPFVRSPPSRRQLPLLRRAPGAAIHPRRGRDSGRCCRDPLCHILQAVKGF